MTALHVAAFYGEEDIVRELMRHVPPSVASEVTQEHEYELRAL